MKAISFVTSALMLCVSEIALSQSETHQPDGPKPDAQQASAQLAFARLTTLAGNWKGQAAMGSEPGMATAPVRVSLRVTSGGDALMHEMVPEGRSDDPSRGDDDPITMLYIDGDRLLLTHYCDSGKNRPRQASRRQTAGEWNSTFSTSPATQGTDICTMQYSRASMLIIAPRTRLI
jgi:hypothetical protein